MTFGSAEIEVTVVVFLCCDISLSVLLHVLRICLSTSIHIESLQIYAVIKASEQSIKFHDRKRWQAQIMRLEMSCDVRENGVRRGPGKAKERGLGNSVSTQTFGYVLKRLRVYNLKMFAQSL